jgi:hypothetical protein
MNRTELWHYGVKLYGVMTFGQYCLKAVKPLLSVNLNRENNDGYSKFE